MTTQQMKARPTIRGYEIISSIKSGGMATLYLGRRSGPAGFSRLAAIKLVHPHLTEDKSFIKMFIDEAVLSARINHPNVVSVLDFGEEHGRYFLIMEYVNGCSLAELIRNALREKKRLKVPVVAHIVMRAAEGLHAIHTAVDENGEPLDIIHRDVTPSNLMLSKDGHVKVIDLGIAKAKSRLHETVAQSLKGKLRYMSPEQATGGDLDPRADVYALGVVLWETLCTRRLFKAENELEMLDLIKNPKIDPPSMHNPEVPPELDSLVMRSLSPNPDERPTSAEAFRKELGSIVPEAMSIETASLGTLVGAAAKRRKESQALDESLSGSVSMQSAVRAANAGNLLDTMSDIFDSDVVTFSQGSGSQSRTTHELLPWWKRNALALTAVGGLIVLAGYVVAVTGGGQTQQQQQLVAPSSKKDVEPIAPLPPAVETAKLEPTKPVDKLEEEEDVDEDIEDKTSADESRQIRVRRTARRWRPPSRPSLSEQADKKADQEEAEAKAEEPETPARAPRRGRRLVTDLDGESTQTTRRKPSIVSDLD